MSRSFTSHTEGTPSTWLAVGRQESRVSSKEREGFAHGTKLSLPTLSSEQDPRRVGEGLGHLEDDLRGSGGTGPPGDSRGASGLQEVLQAQREHPPPFFRPHPALLPTAEAGAGQAPWEEAVSLAPCPPVQGWTGRGRSHAWRYKRQPGHRGNELSLSLAAGRWQQAYSALQPSLRAPSPPWSPCPPPCAPSL